MKKEFWRVVLFTARDDIYSGSERFDSKWKAEQYISEQKGRMVDYRAKLQHWQMQSEQVIEIKRKES